MIPPLFVDENVGRRVKDCLVELGFEIRTHVDIALPLGVKDEEWIAAVAARGWAAITADVSQSRKSREWRAVQSGPIKHVVVHSKKLTAALAVEILQGHQTALKVVLHYLPAPFTLKLLESNMQLKSYHRDYSEIVRTHAGD